MAIAHEEIQTAGGQTMGTEAQEREERTHLDHLLQNAFSLTEVQEAARLMRDWSARHPDQKDHFSSIFEQLALAEESAREAEAEARALGLTTSMIQQREHVIALRRLVRAEDPVEIFEHAFQAAFEALKDWQAIHPADPMNSHLHDALNMEAEAARAMREAA